MATEWASVCIKLLQGPIYENEDDSKYWRTLLQWQSEVIKYFEQIGVSVFIDIAEGYAFLEQNEDDEVEAASLKLIRRYPLTFEMSLLCVLLREELERFDVSQNESASLVMRESDIRDLLSVYFKEKTDQVKLYKDLDKYLNQAVDLTFLREIKSNSGQNSGSDSFSERQFEVRRILRAKIDVEFLAEFKKRLTEYIDNAV